MQNTDTTSHQGDLTILITSLQFVPRVGFLRVGNSSFAGSTFEITVAFTLKHNGETWKLSVVYGPCAELARTNFLDWMKSLSIEDDGNWILMREERF